MRSPNAGDICQGNTNGNANADDLPKVTPAEMPTEAPAVAPAESTAVERQVRKFGAETDKWVRACPVTVEDAQAFSEQLKEVPKARRIECLHRALNLIPDANVTLLAGIVLDKSQDQEVVETTFRDIINRAEEVKKPIVEAILRDKSHPCYSDAEWIYEVTGEKVAE